ncbi:MAG: flagellar biosynthesis protein [Burkholderiales bacterium]|nr:flagellar biosynthesis protein [Burkholderiales bacterium]
MRNDFYGRSAPAPYDQAQGLRRLFAGGGQRVLTLAANPHVAFAGVVIDQVTAALTARRRRVLVVDAADRSPAPQEMALLDLAAAIEPLSPQVSYLAARGLPRAYVDTRGSAAGFVDALTQAAPQADVVLLHANTIDLARMFMRRATRPMIMGADHPESIKHAYASCKLLAQRCKLMTFDLLLAAAPTSRRVPGIASSLASCADGFVGAVLHDWALIDPAAALDDAPEPALERLLAAQLALQEDAPLPALHATN